MLEFDGTKLKRLREKRGLTRAELGSIVGKEQTHIWNYENGVAAPPADTLLNFVQVFKVQASALSKPKECSSVIASNVA